MKVGGYYDRFWWLTFDLVKINRREREKNAVLCNASKNNKMKRVKVQRLYLKATITTV